MVHDVHDVVIARVAMTCFTGDLDAIRSFGHFNDLQADRG
jgi:hypothetical protein